MIDLKINNDREVSVNALSMDFTYGGLLTYPPSEDLNRKIFERASYPANWGHRALLKLKPKEANFKSFLDPCYYCVWLSSEWVKQQESHGSNLLVIWFDDLPNKRSIEEIIAKGIKDINWEANAEDFCF